jgi:hypothetical protein
MKLNNQTRQVFEKCLVYLRFQRVNHLERNSVNVMGRLIFQAFGLSSMV